MCYSVYQRARFRVCVAVCCSLLQCGAVCVQCVAVCCSMLLYVAVCCSVLQCVQCVQCISEGLFIVCCSLLQSAVVCCSLLQCTTEGLFRVCHCVEEYIKGPFQSVCQYVAVCCSVLQYVAVCIRGPTHQIGPSLHFGWFVAIFFPIHLFLYITVYIRVPFQSVCQCVAIYCSMLQRISWSYSLDGPLLWFGWIYFSTRLFFCVAVYMRGPIQSGGRCVAVCCIVLLYVAVCCSVYQMAYS